MKQGDRIDATALMIILSSNTESLAALAKTLLCASDQILCSTGYIIVISVKCSSCR